MQEVETFNLLFFGKGFEMAKKAKKVAKASVAEANVAEAKAEKVKRLPALSLSDLHKAYATVEANGGTYESLAEMLGRPLNSVVQRVAVLRKRLKEEYNTELGALTRKSGGGRGRSKEDLAAIAEAIKAQKANVEAMG